MHRIKLIITALLIFGPMSAQAVPITITGQGASDGVWDVTTLLCDRLDPNCQVELIAQEWFGNSDLARAFAVACFECLGYPNQPPNPGTFTPWFMYQQPGLSILGWAFIINNPGVVNSFSGGFDVQNWAVASRVAVPEPGTLALFTLGLLGLGFARKRAA